MIRRKHSATRPWKPSRRERRVLLALLSGAGNLHAVSLRWAAQAGPRTVYRVVVTLERQGWLVSEWDGSLLSALGRREYFSLTPRGRERVLALLGLEESR